ncbi:hypothetical protein LCM17_02540 [Cereibacter sphaeroides]|nr:hypothetical protein [Cereibacter sphaeroides]
MTPPRTLTTITAVLLLVVAANLWIFARFTVDDAFITWRYGLTLIRHGIWAYNPDGFDLAQAYTNPIYALASILPAGLGWDMVLTFKLISLALLGLFGWAFLRLAGDRVLMGFVLALLMAVPATVAHAISGLETLLYGGALALWFIAQERRDWRLALGMVAVLVLTRPEAWLLFALHPLALLMARADWGRVMRHSLALGLLAGVYFGFHLWWFGSALPNTYYVKAGDGFSGAQALRILPYALPGLAVALWGDRRTGLLLIAYFGAVGYSYAGSDLLMNYLQRFPFQIVLPIALYLGWALSHATKPGTATLGLTAYVLAFGWHSWSLGDHLGIANYYPRLLNAHAALGRAIADSEIEAFALQDAGAPAFHADRRALDTIGLASALVAREGLGPEVLRQYNPALVGFLADAEGIVDRPDRHAALWSYVEEQGFTPLCTLVWAPHYQLALYTAGPQPEVEATCARSAEANGAYELPFALAQLQRPPWAYWHE